MRSHLKVYFSFEDDTKALTDQEKGNLLLAMLRYARDGEEQELEGNERFLFPVFKAQIDRDVETYNVKVMNGSKGGRPVINQKPEETENNLKKPNETETNREESKKTETPKIEDRRYKIEDKRYKTEDVNKGRFTPPTYEQVADYCKERGKGVDPERWFNYYTANGWKVGKNPMKDWKAAVMTWEKDAQGNQSNIRPMPTVPAQQYHQRDYHDSPEEQNRKIREQMERLMAMNAKGCEA